MRKYLGKDKEIRVVVARVCLRITHNVCTRLDDVLSPQIEAPRNASKLDRSFKTPNFQTHLNYRNSFNFDLACTPAIT